ncbi:MAG: phosphoglucosamine mutase [Clostridiales bacterium]|jgi:phosphoglucosamine mutase|nr:phosphoglucosamine mutase [Clostridiales bacterium]
MSKLFGTDGVRGIANTELTPELVFKLGRAGAYALTKIEHHSPRIIVGTDTRVSKDMLSAALIAGMCSVGATVYNAGILPTPGIAYLVRAYKLDAGVVISASHNTMEYNGIKFFNIDGYKLPDKTEEEIEELIQNDLSGIPTPTGEGVGTVENCRTALEDYVSFLKSTVPGLDLNGLTVAVDCANGATYQAAPMLFEQLGANVCAMHHKPDGLNINKDCGSTHMESLIEFMKTRKADIGLALDGDGDRLLCVDEKGNMLDGDQILSICGLHLKRNGSLKNNTIVITIMSNLGLYALEKTGDIRLEITGVGDRYVLERMLEQGYNLGGEQSGHIIFLDYNTTGDGLMTALQLLSIMRSNNESLSNLNSVMKVMPQVLYNVTVANDYKENYNAHPIIKEAIEQLTLRFKDTGRVLIRPSGTEPVIRVMLEGQDQTEIELEARKLVKLMETCLQ